MPNKKSCRACGINMTTTAVCGVCKENMSWRCSRCNKIEDTTHLHTYEQVNLGNS